MRRFRIPILYLFVTAKITTCFTTLFFNTVNFRKQLSLLTYINPSSNHFVIHITINAIYFTIDGVYTHDIK